MAKPITWQNVNGPSLTEAAAPMAAAQRSFDTAFSRVGDELVRRQATQDANFAQAKTNNTEAFLAQLSQFRTPEELAAAQQEGGALDILTKRFGGQVDQTAIRQAQDLRPGLLQERIGRENQFNDAQLDREQAPTRDAIMAAVNRGDILTANVLMSGAPNLRNVAALEAASTQAQRAAVQAARGDSEAAHQAVMRPLDVKRVQGAIDAQAAQVKTNEATQLSLDEDRKARRKREDEEAAAKKVADAIKARELAIERASKGTVMEGGTLNDAVGQAALTKAMDEAQKAGKLTDSARRDILYNLNEYMPNGMYKGVPVPASVALQVFQESEENAAASLIPGWSRRGDNFANLLEERMKNPELLVQINGVLGLKRKAEAGEATTSVPVPGAPAALALPTPNPAALLRQDVVTNAIGPRRLKMLQDAKELHLKSGNVLAAKSVDEQIARETGAKK